MAAGVHSPLARDPGALTVAEIAAGPRDQARELNVRCNVREVVDQYRGAIERAELLVIDLRGNEGGSAFVTNVFMPYLVTPEKRSPRYLEAGGSAVLSSPDNIDYFGRMSWAPEGLVARLQASPGELVPYLDAPDSTETPVDTATARRIAAAAIQRGHDGEVGGAYVSEGIQPSARRPRR